MSDVEHKNPNSQTNRSKLHSKRTREKPSLSGFSSFAYFVNFFVPVSQLFDSVVGQADHNPLPSMGYCGSVELLVHANMLFSQ